MVVDVPNANVPIANVPGYDRIDHDVLMTGTSNDNVRVGKAFFRQAASRENKRTREYTVDGGKVDSQPIFSALADVGWMRRRVLGDGSCFIRSVVASHELSVREAATAGGKQEKVVALVRKHSVDLLVNWNNIDGVPKKDFRVTNRLGATDAVVEGHMGVFRAVSHALSNCGSMLGHASLAPYTHPRTSSSAEGVCCAAQLLPLRPT